MATIEIRQSNGNCYNCELAFVLDDYPACAKDWMIDICKPGPECLGPGEYELVPKAEYEAFITASKTCIKCAFFKECSAIFPPWNYEAQAKTCKDFEFKKTDAQARAELEREADDAHN